MPARLATAFYEFCYWIIYFSLTLGFSYRAAGRGNVPRRGPVLLVANHLSFLDPISVGLASKRHLHYLARKTLFANPILGTFLRVVNCVPIDQDGVGVEGIRNILARLAAGHPVLIFPEGERSWDGQLNDLRPGIALLMKRVRAPIVPVGVAGTFDAWPRSRPLPIPAPLFFPPSRRSIAVVVGPPRDPATLEGLPRDRMLAVLRDDILAAWKQAEALRRK
jgi:1-acyl-sn-glycerol-3-phosphate acyltransferase